MVLREVGERAQQGRLQHQVYGRVRCGCEATKVVGIQTVTGSGGTIGRGSSANTANTASTRAGREKSRVQAPPTTNRTLSRIPFFACLRVRARWYAARRTLRAARVLTPVQSNPTQIFAEDVTEEKGENARLSAFVGAIAVGDLVKSTLGPKGMDKILQSA